MLKRIEKYFFEKKILILGFGLEGHSTYRLLRRILPDKKLWIADSDVAIRDLETFKEDRNVTFYLGNDYLYHFGEFDMIIKTPGISLKHMPEVDFSIFTSHTELFFQFFRDQIIGVTGTKGKSTTSSLIYHIINFVSQNCLLVGNIGQPPFDLIDQIDKETVIVYELSSHQLEQTSISPKVAVLLNLFQEHLDHYESFEKYQEAKFRITLFQKPEDYFIYHGDDKLILKWIEKSGIRRNFYPFSLTDICDNGFCIHQGNFVLGFDLDTLLFPVADITNLKGEHNLLNILAALDAVVLMMDIINLSDLASPILTFKPLEHRLEFVGKFNGIEYYNDSISTIPEATIAAIKALKSVDTLILGGYDRGIFYDDLMDYLSKSEVRNLIFIGDAGKRMFEIYTLKQYCKKNLIVADNFEQAVAEAKKNTGYNKVCLLSPAAASYGMFKNFAERGTVYKNLVGGL
jgi:UDP-N-acetylmuramoyl-L-alanine---L-glutamate ligase